MFTGIVQTQASVVSALLNDGVMRLVLSVGNEYLQQLTIGASIAVNGCCLTVVQFEINQSDVVGQVSFDVIDESLKLTNLGKLKCGDKVNFERSVTFGTELGGHIVSGHIHDMATVEQVVRTAENVKIKLLLSKEWSKYVFYKGFISVNGASLTVGQVDEDGFWLHLIPETLSITNIGRVLNGDKLNIEVDQQTYTIVNTVEHYLRKNTLNPID
ncbi:riboflavin synthase subunit alpha [Pseudoalteromonas luteoviolacea]|uniref:Riboflavin synthase n=1 Tax=Pseudoalteromonas luteoviolacea TaxID=43657 RepID=A0A1C0TV86_9GAMM|nr:riboflavin synthase [Pseudoalteromonas luteoviolacea]MBQ4809791.1 riboflavin synthase [Pseudoalteromonas luteoviolacea]OCQ23237.1 riboflavin synthase subunit alpha [Pseudoalteromonas luteoviolacea]